MSRLTEEEMLRQLLQLVTTQSASQPSAAPPVAAAHAASARVSSSRPLQRQEPTAGAAAELDGASVRLLGELLQQNRSQSQAPFAAAAATSNLLNNGPRAPHHLEGLLSTVEALIELHQSANAPSDPSQSNSATTPVQVSDNSAQQPAQQPRQWMPADLLQALGGHPLLTMPLFQQALLAGLQSGALSIPQPAARPPVPLLSIPMNDVWRSVPPVVSVPARAPAAVAAAAPQPDVNTLLAGVIQKTARPKQRSKSPKAAPPAATPSSNKKPAKREASAEESSTKVGIRQRRKDGKEPFPTRLHRILTDVTEGGEDHIVSWTESGEAFCIHQPEIFMRDIVPKYFKQGKLSSFKRQLSMYGFVR